MASPIEGRLKDALLRASPALPDTRGAHRSGYDDAVWLYESQPGVEEHW
jgi:hypothetical protein